MTSRGNFCGERVWVQFGIFLLVTGVLAGCVRPLRGEPPKGTPPPGMVWIPGGKFLMGGPSEEACRAILQEADPGKPCCPLLQSGFEDAQPRHQVEVDGYWMDATEVTNADFQKFIDATGYLTVAERKPRAEDFPGASPEVLVPGSVCFQRPEPSANLRDHRFWWSYQPGASWRHPAGLGSDLAGKDNFPVVLVAYEDAIAYARWAGKRLPTEAEWERAARGGKDGETFSWGNEFRISGKWMANTWQGLFPLEDTAEDGWKGLAPVRQFAANSYGLYDVSGNVWEWCSDWYRPDTYVQDASQGLVRNPQGPKESFDPEEPGQPKRAQRGGSYLCSDQFCARYITGTRGKGEISTGSSHVGFRCVKSP